MKKLRSGLVFTLGSIVMATVIFLSVLLFMNVPLVSAENQDSSSSSSSQSESSSSSQPSGNSGNSGSGGNGSGNDGNGVGPGGGGGEMPPSDASNYYFRVRADQAGRLYLREENMGEYTGKGYHGFETGAQYEEKYAIPSSEYFAYALANSGFSNYQVEVEIKAELSRLYPYYQNKIYESDVGIMQYAARNYAYTYSNTLKNKVQSFSSISSEYAAWENEYATFVENNYLSVPYSLKQTLLNLATENDLVAGSSTLILDVVEYIKNAATYDLEAQDCPSNKDMVTYFLTESKRGVCRHYAAAATMMFRALGIPARYTTGFMVDLENTEWLNYGDDLGEVGHAWTEIYIENYGWIQLEVTGGFSGNDWNSVVVETPNKSKKYDGEPLEMTQEELENVVDRVQAQLPAGSQVEIVQQTTLDHIGSISNKIIVRITDEFGEEYGDIKVKYKYGTLTIAENLVEVKTPNLSKKYDGEELKMSQAEVEQILDDVYEQLPTGAQVEVIEQSSLQEVGSIENKLVLKITDEFGNEYDGLSIAYDYGKLTIAEKIIEVKTPNLSKKHDGEPLTMTQSQVDAILTSVYEQLPTGAQVEVIEQASLDSIGSTKNKLIIRITDENGNAYNGLTILYKYGTLTIAENLVEVKTPNMHKQFDGEELKMSQAEVDQILENVRAQLPANAQVEVEHQSSLQNVGEIKNQLVLKITDEFGEKYEGVTIEYDYGYLSIIPIYIYLDTPDMSKEYDGTPLTMSQEQVEDVLYPLYHRLPEGYQTEVLEQAVLNGLGAIPNKLVVRLLDKDGNDYNADVENIVLEWDYGTLTVAKKFVQMSATPDMSKVYDGELLTMEQAEVDAWIEELRSKLPATLHVECIGQSSIRNVDVVSNEIYVKITDEDGKDCTDDIDIQYNRGMLSIEAKRVTMEKTPSASKEYDGTPLQVSKEEIDVWLESLVGDLPAGTQVQVIEQTSIVNVGSVESKITLQLKDEQGVDISGNIDLTIPCGQIEITPKKLKITTASKMETGVEKIECKEYEIEGLATGDRLSATNLRFAVQLGRGVSPNEINYDSLKIISSNGKDVTKNYQIEIVFGTLVIY